MPQSWKSFEEKVRSLAGFIWGAEGLPRRIAGVDIDCVVDAAFDHKVLIEITEERSLHKVREDVVKLITAKNDLYTREKIFCRCFCIVDAESVTQGMVDAGSAEKIHVMTGQQFERMFFAADEYTKARLQYQFGSAVDPVSGERDETPYVPVQYVYSDQDRDCTIEDIANMLLNGRNVILMGEYGSGKSRCVKELFTFLADKEKYKCSYPVAINLRDNWGLRRGVEIIRRHLDDMGLGNLVNSFFRALPSGAFIFLLDGFDEIGSQAWSQDADKLKAIKAQALAGVKDLARNVKTGIFVSGREHYFNTIEEMHSMLGLRPDNTVVLRSKVEFSDEEMEEYFTRIASDFTIPSWLPKRPLICRAISAMNEEDIERIFAKEGGDVDFWHDFIKIVCERDALIHQTFDADTILTVLKYLAQMTRTKEADVGPLTIGEIQSAFEKSVGQAPIEQASLMLQRLPGLGRIRAESDDRQFIDRYILDGLRAVSLSDTIDSFSSELGTASWQNPLGRLGQRILADHIGKVGGTRRYVQFASKLSLATNRIVAPDIVASLAWSADPNVDLKGVIIENGTFLLLDLSGSQMHNITISKCVIFEFILPSVDQEAFTVKDCMIGKIFGITGPRGLPPWVQDCTIEGFQSIENVAGIRELGLRPTHEMLVAMVRKTFLQKGSGRKEEALIRGLGRIATPSLPPKVVNLLLRHDVLSRFKGEEGWVYTPNRQMSARMEKMLSDLSRSTDPLWIDVGRL